MVREGTILIGKGRCENLKGKIAISDWRVGLATSRADWGSWGGKTNVFPIRLRAKTSVNKTARKEKS